MYVCSRARVCMCVCTCVCMSSMPLILRNLFLELVHVIMKVQPSRLTERDPGNSCSLGLKIICCQNSLSSGECNLFFLHQSEWLQSKNLQAISAGEGVEKREPSYTVGGNAN